MKLSTKYIYFILFILIIVYFLYLYSLNKKNIENFNSEANFDASISGHLHNPEMDEVPEGLAYSDLTGPPKNIKPLETRFYTISNDKKYLYPALTDRSSNWKEPIVNVSSQLKRYLPVGQKKTGTYKIYRNKKWPSQMADWYDDDLLNSGDRASNSDNTACKTLGQVSHIREVNLGQNEARQVCSNDDTCDSIVIPKYTIGQNTVNSDNLGKCKMYATRPGFPDELENSPSEHTIIKNYLYTFTISFYIKIYPTTDINATESGIFYYGNGFDKNGNKIGCPIITVQSQLQQPKINFEYVITGNEENKNYVTERISFDLKNIYDRAQNVIIVVNGNDIYGYVDGNLQFDRKIEPDIDIKSELDSDYKYLIFPAYQAVIIGKNPKYPDINGNFEISKVEWSAYALEKSACETFPNDNQPTKIPDPMNLISEKARTISGRIYFNYDGRSINNTGETLCNLYVIDNSHVKNLKDAKWKWSESNSILNNINTTAHQIHNVENSLNNNVVFIDGYIKCNKSFGPMIKDGKEDPAYTLENPKEYYIVGCIPKSFCPNRNIYFLLAVKGGYMIMKINSNGKIVITPHKNMKYIKDTPISLFNIRYIKDISSLNNDLIVTDKLIFLANGSSSLSDVHNAFFEIFDHGQESNNSKSNNSKVSIINNRIMAKPGVAVGGLDGITLLKKSPKQDSSTVSLKSNLENNNSNAFTLKPETDLYLVRDKISNLGKRIIKISGSIEISHKELNTNYVYSISPYKWRIDRKTDEFHDNMYMDKYMQLHKNINTCEPNTFCNSCADKANSLGHTYYGIGDKTKECLTGNSFNYNDIDSTCKPSTPLIEAGCDITMNVYSAETEEVLICNLPEKTDFPKVDMIFLCSSEYGTVRVLVKHTGGIYWLSSDRHDRELGKQQQEYNQDQQNKEEKYLINLDTIIYTVSNEILNPIETALGETGSSGEQSSLLHSGTGSHHSKPGSSHVPIRPQGSSHLSVSPQGLFPPVGEVSQHVYDSIHGSMAHSAQTDSCR